MTTATRIPLPAGALDADEWRVDGTRGIRGTMRGRVEIWGVQDDSGDVLTRHALVVVGAATFDAAALAPDWQPTRWPRLTCWTAWTLRAQSDHGRLQRDRGRMGPRGLVKDAGDVRDQEIQARANLPRSSIATARSTADRSGDELRDLENERPRQ